VFPILPVIATILAAILAGRLTAQPAIRRLRAELADAAGKLTHDPLTGLLNRTGLTAWHHSVAATPVPMIAVLVDLDDFKTVNDTHGHDSGDSLLIEVAERLTELAAMLDGHAARLSGDEYALLLPMGAHRPDGIGALVVNTLGRPVHIHTDAETLTLTCTASVGLTVVGSGDRLEEVALHQADLAMYHAKQRGGNTHVAYLPGMTMPTNPGPGRRGQRPRDLPRPRAQT
jgi:diguanylate cyclase (GGDEF)-like protein